MSRIRSTSSEDMVANQPVGNATLLAQSTLIKELLADAANHSLRSQRHLLRTRLISRLSLITAVFLNSIAITIASAHLFGLTLGFIYLFTGTGFVAAVFVVSASVQRVQVDITEIAERVDLAACDHNAIATALDLISNEHRSEFTRLAIEHGISAARMFGQTKPVICSPTNRQRSNLYLLGLSVAAAALACLIPELPFGGRDSNNSGDRRISFELDQQTKVPPPETTNAFGTRKAISVVNQSSGSIGSPHEASAQSSSQPASQTPEGSSGPAGSAEMSDKNSYAVAAGLGMSTAQPTRSAGPSGRDAGEHAVEAAASGSELPKSDQAVALSELGSAGVASSETFTTSSDWGGAFGGAGSKLKSDKGAASSASTERGVGKTSKSSKSGGSSDQSIASLSSNGQAGGQSPPKKSRSVAPLMLGTLQPDLIQGKQLPGPDQHVELRAPPTARPESPADPATASIRQMPELPVDVFTVPWEAQRGVARYFREFHQNLTPQSANDR